MKSVIFTISLCFLVMTGYSQVIKKQMISDGAQESGCYIYSFCDFNFQTSLSADSSLVFTGSCDKDKLTTGVICVKLKAAMGSLEDAEGMLISYLDYLKTTFSIQSAAGYGKGHRLRDDLNTIGVIDYWQDAEDNNWKVKGWTNGNFLVVLLGYSQDELPEQKLDVFFNSLHFPQP